MPTMSLTREITLTNDDFQKILASKENLVSIITEGIKPEEILGEED